MPRGHPGTAGTGKRRTELYRTSKFMLSALAAASFFAMGSVGQAIGQTRQVQPEAQRPRLQTPTELRAGPKGKQVRPKQSENTLKSPSRPSLPKGLAKGPAKGLGRFGAKPPVDLPDFVLEPGLPAGVAVGLPNTGYCLRKAPAASGAANTVAFKIRFSTNGTQSPLNGWGQSKVQVAFTGGESVTLDVPSPSWDGVIPYEVDMPKGCYKPAGYNGACQFTIKVDPANIVPESSNANNNVTSICTQPAS